MVEGRILAVRSHIVIVVLIAQHEIQHGAGDFSLVAVLRLVQVIVAEVGRGVDVVVFIRRGGPSKAIVSPAAIGILAGREEVVDVAAHRLILAELPLRKRMLAVEALAEDRGTVGESSDDFAGIDTFEGVYTGALPVGFLVVNDQIHFLAGIVVAEAGVALPDFGFEGGFRASSLWFWLVE